MKGENARCVLRSRKIIFSLVLLITMIFSKVVSNNIVEATNNTNKNKDNIISIKESKLSKDEMRYYIQGYRKIMPWKRIKEGDFFVYAQEAIGDVNGDILGWVDGVIKQDNGKYNEDGNWESNLKIEKEYFPIIGNKDGSGSWRGILNPDNEGITYYRIAESKKYQERNSKGELLYYQEDGSKGTNVTGKRVLADGPLKNVRYDNSTYYLKFENGSLEEVRLLFKNQMKDPFSNLKIYSKDEIKRIADRIIVDEEDVKNDNNPINYFVDYLKDQEVKGIGTEEFENFYDYGSYENIYFENQIWPWGPEVPTEPTKPEEPTEPTKPEEPTEPTKPEIPTEPTNPEIPTEPTKPEIPTEPTKPEIPTEPTKPEEPTEPTRPEIPTEPTKPEIPTEPTKPGIPTEPTKYKDKLPQMGIIGSFGLSIFGTGLIAVGFYHIKNRNNKK